MTELDAALEPSRRAFVEFLARCQTGETEYRLTTAADQSPYARCFGVYCQHLAARPMSQMARTSLADMIRAEVRCYRAKDIDPRGKPYRQLLTFSLSALAALRALADDPLEDLVAEQIAGDVRSDLQRYGCLTGVPGSGNQAMFTAIFLLHARDYLRRDCEQRIQDWVNLHLDHMNRFGFWGSGAGMTHLQFQNGYHQCEVLEYLGIRSPRQSESVAAVRSLADPDGHFAPYPGGGGCYDYDAVCLLTPGGRIPDSETRVLLDRTALTLLAEQRPDGGFAESVRVRPRAAAATRMLAHVVAAREPRLFLERLRYAMAVQRPKHNRIHTHWSRYSRRWDESDLWDSWFRMMTLARIQVAIDPGKASTWGFIDYPGLGHHPCLRPDSTP